MTLLNSLIFGIIEGITEFLPISSTGHLILAGQLLNVGNSEFVKSFEIIIQLGAILAVVVLYRKQLFNISVLKKVAVAFIPTGIIGLALYKLVKTYLLGNQAVVLWAMLLGGIALIVFELWYKRPAKNANDSINLSANGGANVSANAGIDAKDEIVNDGIAAISYKQSFIVGLCQSVAIIPGVSRSAATIVGGLALGLSRKTIVEFSFLLAVPVMLAASGLDIIKNPDVFAAGNFMPLVVGFIVSFIVAALSIKFLLGFIKKYDFIPFGIYRIAAAIVFWLVIFG